MQFFKLTLSAISVLSTATFTFAVEGTFNVTEAWRVTLTYENFGRGYTGVKVFSGTQQGTIAVNEEGHYDLIDRTGVRWGSTRQDLTARWLYQGGGFYYVSGNYPFAPAFGLQSYGIVFLGCFIVKVPLVGGEVPAFFDFDYYSGFVVRERFDARRQPHRSG
jgi:hypothetical protein